MMILFVKRICFPNWGENQSVFQVWVKDQLSFQFGSLGPFTFPVLFLKLIIFGMSVQNQCCLMVRSYGFCKKHCFSTPNKVFQDFIFVLPESFQLGTPTLSWLARQPAQCPSQLASQSFHLHSWLASDFLSSYS